VYGLLKEHSEAELRDFIYQLIGQGALTQENLVLASGRTAPILKFTRDSLGVLKGQLPIRLVQIIHKSAKEARKTRGEEVSWEGVDHELFDALRGLRKQVATERSVPPYVIFSDATLREMARIRPTSMQNFRLVYGIGENKLKDLGLKFMPFVADFCKSKGLATDVFAPTEAARMVKSEAEVARSVAANPAKQHAFAMFRQGASAEEVSAAIARARATVMEYLADFIAVEKPASIAAWVPESNAKRIEEAYRRLNTSRLKPLFMELGEHVPYDQIRLVVAHLGVQG
jgi:ATP-dependent DNA helicase RecQ